MTRPVRKAIFPVAGLGTRFLPATKSMPKEMLTVVDKPVIHYGVDEARAAGIEQFIFVTSRGKSSVEDHFDRAPELERSLQERGKKKALAELDRTLVNEGEMYFVRQQAPLGLGHAIWCARHLIGDEPFAVMLPDEVMETGKSCIADLIAAHNTIGRGHVLAVKDVPREQTKSYGILDPSGPVEGRIFQARGMVEKPAPADAPSTFAAIGRYVLEPEVFAFLDKGLKGAGDEIQLTDAIASTMGDAPLYGCIYDGARYDCGDKLGFLKANIVNGLAREDLAQGLRAFMRDVLENADSAS